MASPLSKSERQARLREKLAGALASFAAPRSANISSPSSVPIPLRIGAATSEGDVAHRADQVRSLGFNGAGIRIGVLSDSFNRLGGAAADVASGDLPGPGNPFGNNTAVTVVQESTQATGNTDEGRAMLQIVHDLAPGAQLFFATALGGQANMANNITTLQSANNCNIIIDDFTYFAEAVFQDGTVSQAVNTVTAAGALYFSDAGNSGNLTSTTTGVSTAGAWEGDFVDGGTLPSVPGGRVHDFGGNTTSNQIVSVGQFATITLKWSDPLGGSGNDYDLFILDPTLTTVRAASTNTQSGTQTPVELVQNPSPPTAPLFFNNDLVVILRRTGAATRALHLDTNRGVLGTATTGQTFGHNAAGSAFCVAAVSAMSAGGGVFVGGATNPNERFSSDGPRRIFYDPAGNALTPGNILFATNGGQVLQKPDFAAADRVTNTFFGPGNVFSGTSAAAPHAGAIAALLLSFNPALTPAQIRTALTSSTLDNMAAGVDRDSGFGIVMAIPALATLTPIVDLRVTKSASPSTVVTGTAVTYTIVVSNAGPSPATNMVVTDNLPVGTTFSTCGSTAGGVCGGGGNSRTITFASLAAGGSATITLAATVNCSVPNGTILTNTASATSSDTELIPGDNSSSTSITVSNPPPTITCPADIDTFSDPGQVFATLNPGTPVTSDGGGCPVVVTGVRSDARPLTDTYPVGTTTITWTATDAANQTATCVQTIKVRTLADLQVIISAPSQVDVGQTLTYRIDVKNFGPSPAFGVTLLDVLPSLPQMSLISVSSSGGVCSGNPNVSCGMGTIVQGDTATVLIIVRSLQPGLTINEATATVDTVLTLDPVPDNNQFGKPVRIRP